MLPVELTIVAAAALPALVFVWLMDRFDRFRREPRVLLVKLLLAGIISALAAVLLELVTVPLSGFFPAALEIQARAFFGIAVPEEAVKLVAMMLVVRRRKEFDEILDGAVYGVTAAMGFALLENILYVFGSGEAMSVALIRGVTAVPLHALAGGFMGLAIARFRLESRGSIAGAFLVAVAVHGLYDWILMDPRIPGMLIIPVLMIGWTALIISLKKARNDDCRAARHFPD